MSIVEKLQKDVEEWASSYKYLLTNERDLQVRLAIWLEGRGYSNVFTEYRVPLPELIERSVIFPDAPGQNINFPWDKSISVDIVVEIDGHYACLELKYATRPIVFNETIFSETLQSPESKIIKNQAASDIVMYNYWKDVRRIEALTEVYPAVEGGVAMMITNNHIYWQKPKPTSSYLLFSMHEERSPAVHCVGPGELRWGKISKTVSDRHPNMKLAGSYPCHWADTAMPFVTDDKSHDKFRYLISTIKKK